MRSLRARDFSEPCGAGSGVGVVVGRGGRCAKSIPSAASRSAAAVIGRNSNASNPSAIIARRMTWWEAWFGEEYLDLYPHRDLDSARREAAFALAHLPRAAPLLDLCCGS